MKFKKKTNKVIQMIKSKLFPKNNFKIPIYTHTMTQV